MLAGGIGDILLCHDGLSKLPFLRDECEIYLLSHYIHAPKLIEQFGFDIKFYHYSDNDHFNTLSLSLSHVINDPNFLGHVRDYNVTPYPVIKCPYTYRDMYRNPMRKSAAIHPIASGFANKFLEQNRN